MRITDGHVTMEGVANDVNDSNISCGLVRK